MAGPGRMRSACISVRRHVQSRGGKYAVPGSWLVQPDGEWAAMGWRQAEQTVVSMAEDLRACGLIVATGDNEPRTSSLGEHRRTVFASSRQERDFTQTLGALFANRSLGRLGRESCGHSIHRLDDHEVDRRRRDRRHFREGETSESRRALGARPAIDHASRTSRCASRRCSARASSCPTGGSP